MRSNLTFLCLLALAVSVFGVEQERFSLTIGAIKLIDLPFAMESYRISAKDKIDVEEVNKQQLRIIGKSEGECNLSVTGAGVSVDYIITVKGTIDRLMKRLRNDLETLPELDLAINQDYIVINGTVSKPANWTRLQKVLQAYKDSVHCFAVFRPTAETIMGLKKSLMDAGFEFAEEGQAPAPGQLDMKISQDALIVNGELWSQAAIDKVKQILSLQTWLAVGDENPSEESGKIRGLVSLSVVETMLTVDVVYVAVSESDGRNVGTDAPEGLLGLNFIYDVIAGRKNEGASIVFGGNMERTVRFLASNGISRAYNAGHVSFSNYDEKGGELFTGGKVSVKVSGVENGSLQDIDYGLTIKITGGLISQDKVRLDLDLTNASAVASTGDTFSRSVDTTRQRVVCELGKTLVVAGSRKIGQDVQQSGLPVLRNTPVLKWFVSTDGTSKNESRLLILVCPRLSSDNENVQIEVPLEQETAGTYEDGTTDLKEKKDAERAAKPWYKRWFGF